MVSMISQIEDAMIAKIKTATLGYIFKGVKSYGGELNDLNQLAAILPMFPAAWIAFQGEPNPRPYGLSKTKWVMSPKFAILIGCRNVRSEEATRHGLAAAGEVGAYQMIQDVRAILTNQDLGLSIERLSPGAIKSLFNSSLNMQSMAIFALEMHTRYITTAPLENVAAYPDLLSIALNYSLLPEAPSTVAASDVVNRPA